MHLKRIMTGLVALPILIYLIAKGGLAFFVLVLLAALLALWEYLKIVCAVPRRPVLSLLSALAMIMAVPVLWAAFTTRFDLIALFLAVDVILAGMTAVVQYSKDKTIFDAVVKQLAGLVYVPVLLGYILLLRNGSDGMIWVYLLICLVFSNDIGAFYAGTFFGKHKLCPSVSPGKTIEGSLGGLTACFIVGIAFRLFLIPGLSWGWFLLSILCIAVAGPMGDLFESIIKRSGNIKDSGSILPGHGGMLDRIDALLFASPVAYICKTFLF
ncbi:MAG: phosphatidate cytidylyltransferase [Desulfobacterales bacterium]|nr:phosphatidate cytidylyltransferase [Desulfobacterales bacterium]